AEQENTLIVRKGVVPGNIGPDEVAFDHVPGPIGTADHQADVDIARNEIAQRGAGCDPADSVARDPAARIARSIVDQHAGVVGQRYGAGYIRPDGVADDDVRSACPLDLDAIARVPRNDIATATGRDRGGPNA